MKFTKEEMAFLEPARVARLATVDAGGIPHNVPICPVYAGGRFYFGTEAESKKVRNIKANGNVSLVFDEYTESWGKLRGVMIRGQAKIAGKQEFELLRRRLYEKFSQYQASAPLDEKGSVIVEVVPRDKFSWGF